MIAPFYFCTSILLPADVQDDLALSDADNVRIDPRRARADSNRFSEGACFSAIELSGYNCSVPCLYINDNSRGAAKRIVHAESIAARWQNRGTFELSATALTEASCKDRIGTALRRCIHRGEHRHGNKTKCCK